MSSSKLKSTKQLYNHITDIIFTEDTERFQQLQELIMQIAPEVVEKDKLLLLKHLFSIKERWATAYQPQMNLFGIHTLARAEAVRQLLLSRLYGRSSIIELIKLIEDVDKKIIQRSSQQLLSHSYSDYSSMMMVHHPLLY